MTAESTAGQPVDLLAALQRSIEQARAARRAGDETTVPESPAALIRRAAERLREAAEAATEGRWEQGETGHYYNGGRLHVTYSEVEPCIAAGTSVADAAYIALADPVVGAALADWLDAEAAVIESWRDMVRDEDDLDATGVAALTLARSILRETGESE